MKAKHALWLVCAPVVVAVGIVALLFLGLPKNTRQFSKSELQMGAISLSNDIFKGQALKTQAMDKGYVPFFGSSELARQDTMHPSVLAAKYKRSYRPFLLGKAGAQSLTQFFGMQSMTKNLSGKKAVFILSPQWFTKVGQNKNAFAAYYSPLSTASWLLNAKNTFANRYAAKRLLKMDAMGQDVLMKESVQKIAKGQSLSLGLRVYLHGRLKVSQSEDQLFTTVDIKDRMANLFKKERNLPKHYSFQELDKIATVIGQRQTNSNGFQIYNKTFETKLKGERIKRLKGEQRRFDYRRSPEFGDLELVLNQFKQSNTNVLFVMPPVNAKWAKYTGLSTKMLKQTNQKIKYQLKSQGFTNVLDLTNKGNVKYFMQDTIHLGWRGWLAVDKKVKPFLEKQQRQPSYQIDSYYYSKSWQNKVMVKE
ncbi:D-alanyl-lipoteichoic acid biosynthesis protein DltD [Levilactobacillus brevis]|uniref:D-alanyl-lipoteichoic acid biosynthesis protein DltD n=1 Tax=Levilactobacillus brevis TaxID=1580 RepID=UPI001117F707|nr:D-alanyl-lipoteichoic acid biosynthesis protein DltD [Levilactobacillus brevis]QCZ46824.1 Hypothtetical protein [Levilactobacillus brevis]